MLLGEILILETNCKSDDVLQALTIQEEREMRIGEILVASKIINEEELAFALSKQLGLPYLADIPREIDPKLVENVPMAYSKKFKFLAFEKENDLVKVATSEPLAVLALDDLHHIFDANLEVYVTSSQRTINSINQIYSDTTKIGEDLEEDLGKDEEEESVFIDIVDSEDDAPIIKFVNGLLFRAVKERASDIHIEPMEKEIVVRFRIDGVLFEITRPPKQAQAAITSRIKIMGDLNIAEKRLPQDGRIRIKSAGKDIDIRLSTLPTSHGERIVMRLLDRSAVLLEMSELGFLDRQYRIFRHLIEQPHGILLVTGPTGSGKTTTLYSALSSINTPDKNIITVEDPVEYQLQGIGQIPVNRKIDMTFANGLRAILRQDPDVIMIGEIRDLETAEIAIQSSLTGHLVFSTIHTNDSSSTVTRMIDMGVEPFLVASSVIGILAQRLVRLVCQHCKEAYEPSDEELQNIGLDRSEVTGPFYNAVGCPRCLNKGYSGRKGIYELLPINEKLQSIILQNRDANEIKRAALAQGMLTLRMDGVEKIKRGWTTVEEVLRVTQDEMIAD